MRIDILEMHDGPSRTFTEAATWCRAAEPGDTGAQNNLGLLYDKIRKMPQDFGEAIKWFR